jgi:hypothetical protein
MGEGLPTEIENEEEWFFWTIYWRKITFCNGENLTLQLESLSGTQNHFLHKFQPQLVITPNN